MSDMVADAVIAVLLRAASEETSTTPPSSLASTVAAKQGSKGEPASIAHRLDTAGTAWREAWAAGDTAGVQRAELQAIGALMAAQFGPAVIDEEGGSVRVQVGGAVVPGIPGGPGSGGSAVGSTASAAVGGTPAAAQSQQPPLPSSATVGTPAAASQEVVVMVGEHTAALGAIGALKVAGGEPGVRARVERAVTRLLEALRPVDVAEV